MLKKAVASNMPGAYCFVKYWQDKQQSGFVIAGWEIWIR
jgi:hypothetical protein